MQVAAQLCLEDLEDAISEGRTRFGVLETEWKAALRAEQWAATLKLAADCEKEAGEIDSHLQAFGKILSAHQAKLDKLRGMAAAAGRAKAFQTTGIRHVFRCLDWVVLPFAPFQVEKPNEQYRRGYASVFKEQIANAEKVQENPEPEQGEEVAA